MRLYQWRKKLRFNVKSCDLIETVAVVIICIRCIWLWFAFAYNPVKCE